MAQVEVRHVAACRGAPSLSLSLARDSVFLLCIEEALRQAISFVDLVFHEGMREGYNATYDRAKLGYTRAR